MNNDEKSPINKGVELMLRRVVKEPVKHGLHILKKITLLKKQFIFKLEFTWRDLN